MITLEFKIVLSSKAIFGLNLEVTENCNTSYMLSLSLSYSILLKNQILKAKTILLSLKRKTLTMLSSVYNISSRTHVLWPLLISYAMNSFTRQTVESSFQLHMTMQRLLGCSCFRINTKMPK